MHEVVVKEELPRLIPAVVVEWTEPRYAQTMLRISNAMYPLTSETEHLKRIRPSPAKSQESAPNPLSSASQALTSTTDTRNNQHTMLQLLLEAGTSLPRDLTLMLTDDNRKTKDSVDSFHGSGVTEETKEENLLGLESEGFDKKSHDSCVGVEFHENATPSSHCRCRRRRSSSVDGASDDVHTPTSASFNKMFCLENRSASEVKIENTSNNFVEVLLEKRYERFSIELHNALCNITGQGRKTHCCSTGSNREEKSNEVRQNDASSTSTSTTKKRSRHDAANRDSCCIATCSATASHDLSKVREMCSFRLVYVPDRAPRQEPELWTHYNNEIWPFAVPKPTRPRPPSPALVESVSRVMREVVLPLAARRACLGQLGLAAVVVDPSTEEILATSDESFLGVPRTNFAACAPYGLMPELSSSFPSMSCSCTPPCLHTRGDERIDRKLSSCPPNAAQIILDHPVTYALKQLAAHQQRSAEEVRKGEEGKGGKRMLLDCSGDEGSGVVKDGEAIPGLSSPRQGPSSGKPYLANSLDVYVSHEPCVMCAMALVHSRVQRVFFCYRNECHGGLGSCYAVHCLPSLNHHFQAFHCVSAGAQFTPSGQALLCGEGVCRDPVK